MKLFELFATLGLDSRSFNTGLSKAGSAMKSTAKTISTYSGKIESTVGSAFKSILKYTAIGKTAFKAAYTIVGKQALETRSSIEQGVGGAAAVFGDYAKQITGAAQSSYKTAGLSMADYLETANKMGALFKGSGYDVEQASDMTQKAMQRAADVASIMGIDVKMAMESIAGAAKGNFTMMDNLGVAMNDTTLETYRVEKGLSKAVSKMTTAEKVGLAMKMFLEKTSYAAGNYAKENDTVAGSLQTLKGAWANFLADKGSFKEVENSAFGFVINASKSMGLTSLTPALKRVREFVGEVADIISMDDASGKQKYRAIEARIMVRGYKLFKNLGRKLPGQIAEVGDEIVRTISNANSAAPLWLETGKQIFDAVRLGIRKSAVELKDTASILSPAIISGWFTTKSDFLSIGLDILTGIADGITQDAKSDNPQIKAALSEGIKTVITSSVEAIPSLLDAGLSLVTTLGDAVSENSDMIANGVSSIINSIVLFFADANNLEGLVKAGGQIVAALGQGIVQGILTAPMGIVDAVFGTDMKSEAQEFLTELNNNMKEYSQYVDSLGLAPKGGAKGTVEAAFSVANDAQKQEAFRSAIAQLMTQEEQISKTNDKFDALRENIKAATGEIEELSSAIKKMPSKKSVYINVVNGFSGGGGNHTSYLMDIATGHTPLHAKPFASGTPYVPYDNFYSRLHRGEMVLTRQQAEDYRARRAQDFEFDYAQMGAAVGAAIERNMRYLSRQTRAADVVNELGRRINRREDALVRGMGG